MKRLNYAERVIWLDLLRIFAAFCVVTIHIDYIFKDNFANAGLVQNNMRSILHVIISTADPVFFMISGSMMLSNKRNYSLNQIVRKKISKLLIAFAFWSFIYSFINNIIIRYWHGKITEGILKDFVKDFFTGYNHMWFIYALILLYLSIPFLKKICEEKNTELLFIAISSLTYILSFFNYFFICKPLNMLAEQIGLNTIIGYSLFFVIGHYLLNYEIPSKTRYCIYFITLTVVACMNIFNKEYAYLSFPNGLMAVSVFLIFKYGVSKIRTSERSKKFIAFVSSLTFGSYLLHQVYSIAIRFIAKYIICDSVVIVLDVLVSLGVFIMSLFSVYIISKIPILKKYII